MNSFINKSEIFDFIRNSYARINCSDFIEKRGIFFPPVRYFLELTHLCNLNCQYCYIGSDRLKDELTTRQWQDVINQIPFWAFITIVGGEPLIREDFRDILYLAAEKTLGKVNLVTNGLLLNDEIIDAIIDSKMLLLSVSIDGWGKNHDKYRGKEGIFDKIINNLENLSQRVKKEKSKLLIDIKTIVLKDNLEDIVKLYQYATNKGFDFFSISFLRNNNMKQNSKLYNSFVKDFYIPNYPIEKYFDLDEFERVYLEMEKMKKYSKTQIRFAPKFDNKDPKKEINLIKKFFTKYNDLPVKDIYKPCLYPYSNIIINPSGDVYPCLSCKMGNVKENSIKEILNDKKYRCFRQHLKRSKVFSSCQMCCELKVVDKTL